MSDNGGSGVELDVGGHLHLELGRLSASVDKLHAALEQRKRLMPMDFDAQGSGTYPTTGSLVISLGQPSVGRIWEVRNWSCGAAIWTPSATGPITTFPTNPAAGASPGTFTANSLFGTTSTQLTSYSFTLATSATAGTRTPVLALFQSGAQNLWQINLPTQAASLTQVYNVLFGQATPSQLAASPFVIEAPSATVTTTPQINLNLTISGVQAGDQVSAQSVAGIGTAVGTTAGQALIGGTAAYTRQSGGSSVTTQSPLTSETQDALTSLPGVHQLGTRQLVVSPGENLSVVVLNGTSGVQYVAHAYVVDYPLEAELDAPGAAI